MTLLTPCKFEYPIEECLTSTLQGVSDCTGFTQLT